MRTLIKAILPLSLLLTFAGAAAAQTPDGVPPSQETVCDGQTGAAYGLCTAFCEAMDCDSPAKQASQNACDKVAAKFLKITGQAPPCVVTCPCVGGVPGFSEALNGQFGLTSCQERAAPLDLVFLTTGDGRVLGSQSSAADRACGFFVPFGPFIFLSEEEGAACGALLRQKVAAAGLTCTPF